MCIRDRYWVDESKNVVNETTAAYDGMYVSAVFTLAVHEHTVVAIGEGKEATCTEKGLSEGKKCSECGEILEEQVELPLKEHTPVPIPDLEPTETEAGHTGGEQCSVCGTVLTEPTEIPATGSQEETYTITYCYNNPVLVTGTVSVKKGQPILEVLPEVKVEGKEFLYWVTEDKTVVDAAMVAQGDLFVSAVLRTAQEHVHTPVDVEGKEPTCTDTGLTAGSVCGECGEILTAPEVIPAKGHTEVILPSVAATETSTGLTEGKKCSVCGMVLVEQKVIPALIPSTEHQHKLVLVEAVAATASTDGNIAYFKCESCGRLYSDATASVEISAASVVLKATGADETEETENETDDVEDEAGDTEDKTEKPVKETEKKDGTSTAETKKASERGVSSPNTGDETNIFIWLISMLISGSVLLIVRRRSARS